MGLEDEVLLDLFDDLGNAPSLIFRYRAGFHNLDAVSLIAAEEIVCLKLFSSDNNLSVQRVLNPSLDSDDHRLLHFIADDDAFSGLSAIARCLGFCH